MAAMMLLGGCAGMVQKNEQKSAEKLWEARNTQLQNVSQFLMQARASYGRLMPVKADLRWQQNADDTFEIRVSGPFGVGATTISGRPDSVEVRTRNGTYQSNDPEQWIQAKMGWTLPLAGLRFWALGVPSPHSDAEVDLDREGRALLLEQDGWTLNYTEYQQAGGYQLPRKFEVNNASVRLKVVVDNWSSLPASR